MLLSIDVGVKTLSMCILDYVDKKDLSTYSIHLWDVYNTLETEEICNSIQKNKKTCGKKCTMKYNIEDNVLYSCKIHFPKHHDKKLCKHSPKLLKDYKDQELSVIFINKITEIYNTNIEIFEKVSDIVIERQLAKSPRMNFISHILFGKLLDLYIINPSDNIREKSLENININYFNASHKLFAYTHHGGLPIECHLKGKYPARKWTSIQYGLWFLENKFPIDQKEKWMGIATSGKRDDKHDTLNQALSHLIDKKYKQYKKKKKLVRLK